MTPALSWGTCQGTPAPSSPPLSVPITITEDRQEDTQPLCPPWSPEQDCCPQLERGAVCRARCTRGRGSGGAGPCRKVARLPPRDAGSGKVTDDRETPPEAGLAPRPHPVSSVSLEGFVLTAPGTH